MRTAIFLAALALAGVSLAALFHRDVSGPVPAEFVQPINAEALTWKVSCFDPETGHGALGPIQARGRAARATLQQLGGSIQSNNDGAFFAAYGGGVAIETAHPVDEGRKILIGDITLGHPYANSADDPLVKAFPFQFEEGIRFGMPRDEVLKRLFAKHDELTAQYRKTHPAPALPRPGVSTKHRDNVLEVLPTGLYLRRDAYAFRPNCEAYIYNDNLTLYFAHGLLVGIVLY